MAKCKNVSIEKPTIFFMMENKLVANRAKKKSNAIKNVQL